MSKLEAGKLYYRLNAPGLFVIRIDQYGENDSSITVLFDHRKANRAGKKSTLNSLYYEDYEELTELLEALL